MLDNENTKKKKSHQSQDPKLYVAKNKIRFVTATALFDGHDASINIIRRLLQSRRKSQNYIYGC